MALPVQRIRSTAVSRRNLETRRRGVLLPAAVLAIAVLVPLVVLMSSVLLLGWQLQRIETSSMHPRVPAGALAVVEPIDAADVRAGMVVVFDDPVNRGRLVAHRAVKRLPSSGGPLWQTKGDANREPDAYPVPAQAVRGRVRWAIPRLGSIVSALHRPLTAVALVGVPLAVLAATELVALRRRRRARPDERARVYAIRSVGTNGAALVDVFVSREDAERFIDTLRRTDPALAAGCEIEERNLEAGTRGAG